MSVQMIKHEGKMVPAKLVDGKWVPDTEATLIITKDGLEVSGAVPVTKPESQPEPEAQSEDGLE